MRRAALLLLPAALLTGCASNTTHAAPAPTPSLQGDYIKVLQAISPGEDEASITKLGRQVCASLDKGVSPTAISSVIEEGNVNEAGATVIIRGAVATYCPNHSDVVPPQ